MKIIFTIFSKFRKFPCSSYGFGLPHTAPVKKSLDQRKDRYGLLKCLVFTKVHSRDLDPEALSMGPVAQRTRNAGLLEEREEIKYTRFKCKDIVSCPFFFCFYILARHQPTLRAYNP